MARAPARAALTIVTALALAGPAAAQTTTIQADWFEPWYGQGTATLNVPRSDLLGHLTPSFGLFFHAADDLVVEHVRTEDGGTASRTVVGNAFKLELAAALGLFDWVDLGVMVPLVPSQEVEDSPGALIGLGSGGFSVQDIRVALRSRFLRPEQAWGLGVGATLVLWVPSGDDTGFTSDGGIRFETRLLLDWRHESGFLLAANLGYQLRPQRALYNVVVDNSVRWSVATEIPLGLPQLKALVSVFGALSTEDGRDPSDLSQPVSDVYSKPTELVAGLRFIWEDTSLVFDAGGGAGLTEGIGAPSWRAYAAVSYTPIANDKDGDGILDHEDGCPDDPEDRDGFEDTDGCPDPDNDGDGLRDPDDKCPMDPEDRDGFEDDDGCPDPDNDQDGIADVDDLCPLRPENVNGVDDEDGCPDKKYEGVKLTKRQITIKGKIYFQTNKARIQRRSYRLLDQVAEVLQDNPQITKLRIEGHTDDQGPAGYNLTLSQKRAEAVRVYLSEAGVLGARLEAKGFGEARPIATNKTKAGRASNRRVDFFITEVNGRVVAPDDKVDVED